MREGLNVTVIGIGGVRRRRDCHMIVTETTYEAAGQSSVTALDRPFNPRLRWGSTWLGRLLRRSGD